MKTYEEACAIVAEIKLSGINLNHLTAFDWRGAMLVSRIYEKSQHDVANDCKYLYEENKAVKLKGIRDAEYRASKKHENI